jgi:hypothetical protein
VTAQRNANVLRGELKYQPLASYTLKQAIPRGLGIIRRSLSLEVLGLAPKPPLE